MANSCLISTTIIPGAAKCLGVMTTTPSCLDCASRPRKVSVYLPPDVVEFMAVQSADDSLSLERGIEWLLTQICRMNMETT